MPLQEKQIPITNQEIEFTDGNFQTISTTVQSETGIHLTSGKATLVYSRLSKRLRKLGMTHFDEYCTFIATESGAEERINMISALTTNVTSFYREQHHFEDFSKRILPDLLARASNGGKVRIWSAACSSGEEPYSIALEILQAVKSISGFDIKILATDIDRSILDKARTGEYTESVIGKLPTPVVSEFFTKTRSNTPTWRIADRVKDLISFRQLNLIEPWPISGKFDVIFCRNVTIYFDPPTRDAVWQKFSGVLTDSGQLYVGHSERISGPAAETLINNGVTAYRHKNSMSM